MNNNETCIHNGVAPISLLKSLPESQAGSGRHRCPVCAFEQGFFLGSSTKRSYSSYCDSLTNAERCKHGSIAPSSLLSGLGENQGGHGRHKCTNCAFKAGFETGMLDKKTNESAFSLTLVDPPKNAQLKTAKPFLRKDTNFIEKEAQNKHLGHLGELLVLRSEIGLLNSLGLHDLAKKVRHVSAEDGDGAGYDILSFDSSGNKKMIEVKTSRGHINRPFFLTRNELNTSSSNADSYFLYRVFDFDTKLNIANFYVIAGDLQKELNLEALLFSALPI